MDRQEPELSMHRYRWSPGDKLQCQMLAGAWNEAGSGPRHPLWILRPRRGLSRPSPTLSTLGLKARGCSGGARVPHTHLNLKAHGAKAPGCYLPLSSLRGQMAEGTAST